MSSGGGSPAEPTAEPVPRSASDDEAVRRAQALLNQRLSRTQRLGQDQAGLLHAGADELERTGAVTLTTAEGEVRARVTRFRWGDDVIEVTRSRDGQLCGTSRGLLARTSQPARSAALARHLARELAALEPNRPARE